MNIKKFLIVFLCSLSLILPAQQTYNPSVSAQANSTHNVWCVRCYRDKTLVYFDCAASRYRETTFSISARTTLTAKNSKDQYKIKSWGMYDSENDLITDRRFETEYIVDAGTHSIYVMEFDSIPLGIEIISISENIPNGVFWNDIKIKNSAKMEDLPQKVSQVISAETPPQSTPGEKDSNTSWKGTGSGFFLSTSGHIVTNFHVVKNMSTMQIEYYQGGKKYEYPAKVVITDEPNDLAILRIVDDKFKCEDPVPYKLSGKTKDVGTDVFTLGYPLTFIMGEEIKYTKGEISAKSGYQGDIRTYQISVPITHGNSGGPLFDYDGNVVGITSSGLDKQLADNVNYAIKAIYLQTLVDASQENISLPDGIDLSNLTKPELIKKLQEYVVLVRVK